jgi:hypothetical protein
MARKQNAPTLGGEGALCLLADDTSANTTSAVPTQSAARLPGPIVLRHWFRDTDLLAVLR